MQQQESKSEFQTSELLLYYMNLIYGPRILHPSTPPHRYKDEFACYCFILRIWHTLLIPIPVKFRLHAININCLLLKRKKERIQQCILGNTKSLLPSGSTKMNIEFTKFLLRHPEESQRHANLQDQHSNAESITNKYSTNTKYKRESENNQFNEVQQLTYVIGHSDRKESILLNQQSYKGDKAISRFNQRN